MAPPSSLSPSKKLLFTDPKPKSKPKSTPPPPNLASTSMAMSPDKRAQDQPDLSACHGCGNRIDRANPKDQLQLLDSIWRIVLLCRDCQKAIRLGRTCPYCFKETAKSGNNLFQCGGCGRKIHDDCVRDCGERTPWCHLGAGKDGLRVCMDCWVPELLKNSFRVCVGNQSEDELKGKFCGKQLLGKGVKKGKCKVEKVDKEKRIRMPRNGVDLGNVVLALPAMIFKGSGRIENSNSGSDGSEAAENLTGAVDGVRTQNLNSAADAERAANSDAVVRTENLERAEDGGRAEKLEDAGDKAEADPEFAIQLHRAMNNSTRISGTKCSVNSHSLDVLNFRDWSGLKYKRHGLGRSGGGDQKLELSAKNVERPGRPGESGQLKTSANIPESSLDSNVVQNNIHNRFDQELVGYNRTRFKQKVQVNGLASVTAECSSCDNITTALESDNSHSGDTGLGIGFLAKSGTRECLPSGSSDEKGDCSHAEIGMHCGIFESENQACPPALGNSKVGCSENGGEELNLPDQTSNQDPDLCCFKYVRRMRGTQEPDPYHFKYAKRTRDSKSGTISEAKLHSVTFLSEIEALDPGLATDYSAESRNASDVSFDNSTNILPK